MSLDSSVLLMTSTTDVVPANPEGGRRQSKLAEVRQFFLLFGFKLSGLERDWLKIKISNDFVASLHTAADLRLRANSFCSCCSGLAARLGLALFSVASLLNGKLLSCGPFRAEAAHAPKRVYQEQENVKRWKIAGGWERSDSKKRAGRLNARRVEFRMKP